VAGEKHGSAVRDSDGVKPASVQFLRAVTVCRRQLTRQRAIGSGIGAN
jgi:hypothetical protein